MRCLSSLTNGLINLKSKIIYVTGTVSGVLTLTVGVGIFLIWWGARHWFAIALDDFEVYGLFWITIAAPIALVGLFLVLFSLVNNSPRYLSRTTTSLFLILLNIPALYLILEKHSDISKRAYVKLTNKSELNDISLIVSASTFSKKIGKLDKGESLVFNFYPKYLSDPRESVPEVDEVSVSIKTSKLELQTLLPSAYKGWCYRFVLNEELTINYK